jgi:hypothetical protein
MSSVAVGSATCPTASGVAVRALRVYDDTDLVPPGNAVTWVRALLAKLLILAGGLACAYGALILASIGTSDTATGALVAYGLTFAVPGVAAVAAGAWLLHRRRTRSWSARTPLKPS